MQNGSFSYAVFVKPKKKSQTRNNLTLSLTSVVKNDDTFLIFLLPKFLLQFYTLRTHC
jgi:hypothetical protein